jgi:hypothetical protein
MARWETFSQHLGRVEPGDPQSARLDHDFSAAVSLVVDLRASAPTNWEEPANTVGHVPVLQWYLYDAVENDGPQWAVPDINGFVRHRFVSSTATSCRRRFVVPFGPNLEVGLQLVWEGLPGAHPTATVNSAYIAMFIRAIA